MLAACTDTEDMFRRQIACLQDTRMIPRKEAA